ncbi:MAG: hypothetical protein HYU36_16700 [Planctomycetes bacterium]|nr:hypothetical protein [Planctomycetota bacterium]
MERSHFVSSASDSTGRRSRIGRSGFSATELLVVIGIIILLAAIGIPAMLALRDNQKARQAQAEIQIVVAALQDFKTDFGDFPNLALLQAKLFEKASSLPLPAGINLGNEVLVACLVTHLPALYETNGYLPASLVGSEGEKLVDLDGDGFRELADPWTRPYIYFHHSDYHSSITCDYSTRLNADQRSTAQARADSQGAYDQLTSFQFWSCGINQENDTNCSTTSRTAEDDDLRSWNMD